MRVVEVEISDKSKASFLVVSAVFLSRHCPSRKLLSVVPVPPSDTGHAVLNATVISSMVVLCSDDRMVVFGVAELLPGAANRRRFHLWACWDLLNEGTVSAVRSAIAEVAGAVLATHTRGSHHRGTSCDHDGLVVPGGIEPGSGTLGDGVEQPA